MAIDYLSAIDFNGVPAIQFAVPIAATDPVGYTGGIYYNSTSSELKYWNGSTWISLGEQGAGGPPSGGAGGDLSGTYPNPQIAAGVIVDADVSGSANIAQSKIAGLTSALAGKASATVTITAGTGLTGGGDLSNNLTINVAAGNGITVDSDSVSLDTAYTNTLYYTKSQVDTSLGAKVNKAGDTMTGALAMSSQRITNLGEPVNPADAATKEYVDERASGLDPHDSVRVIARTPITLSGLQTIDGVTLVAGDRVLVANQHNGSATAGAAVANGIYVAASGAWARAADADGAEELTSGSFALVEQGTDWAGSAWLGFVPKTQLPWAPGVDDIYFALFHVRSEVTAGNALAFTGNTLDVVAGTGLTASPTDISINKTTTDGWYYTKAQVDSSLAAKANTSTSITAGNGLTGGGTLAANRTISVVGGPTLSVSAAQVDVVSAPKWTTARTLSLTGDVTGSTSIDGSGNVSLATTVVGGSNLAKHFAGNVPAGTAPVITHNLASRDVTVQVYRTTAPYDTVLADVERTTTNTVTLRFATSVAADAFRVVVTGR